jgi:hypothetical protein
LVVANDFIIRKNRTFSHDEFARRIAYSLAGESVPGQTLAAELEILLPA